MTVTVRSTSVKAAFPGKGVVWDTQVPDYTGRAEVRTGQVTDRELMKTRYCW